MSGNYACAANLWLILILLAPGSVHAITDDDLHQVEQQLKQQKVQATALDQKEKKAAEDLRALKEQLVKATAAFQDKQSEQAELEDRLAALEKETSNRSSTLSTTRARLAVLTEALVRLSRQPPESYLLKDKLTDDQFHRSILLRSILPQLQAETDHAAHELSDLENLRRQTAEQKRLVLAARQNLAWQRNNLDEMVKTRQGLLQKTIEQKAATAKQLAALAEEAKDLRQLLDKISPPKGMPEAPDTPPNLQTGLKLPVSGRISRHFGALDTYGVAGQGLTLTGAPESPVVAPRDGRVVFAGPFRGYGQIIILQHGGGYHSFLAGFGRIDADMGETVKTGEPLGVLPGTSTTQPELYFEWRHNGEPVNPMAKNVSQNTSHH